MESSLAAHFDEAGLQLLFQEAGLTDIPAPSPQRVARVIERSLHEKAIKDTASFVFRGFPAAIVGLLEASVNAVGHDQTDYRT